MTQFALPLDLVWQRPNNIQIHQDGAHVHLLCAGRMVRLSPEQYHFWDYLPGHTLLEAQSGWGTSSRARGPAA